MYTLEKYGTIVSGKGEEEEDGVQGVPNFSPVESIWRYHRSIKI